MTRDRKTLQLCRQVEQALNLALADVTEPEILTRLAVLSVQPAPGSKQLSVLIGPIDPTAEIDADEAITAVLSVSGRLRDEVAAEIHRRRTPQLAYRFCRPGDLGSPGGADAALQ